MIDLANSGDVQDDVDPKEEQKLPAILQVQMQQETNNLKQMLEPPQE